YEGTNEINRMLLVGMMIKRAMKGELDIIGPAMDVAKELTSIPTFAPIDNSIFFAEEKEVLKNLKKATLMVAGKAVQTFEDKINDQQEILMNIADMLIEVYAAESTLLRVEKLVNIKGEDACKVHIAAAKVYLYEALDKINQAGKEAIAAIAKGDEQRVMLMGLKRFTKSNLVNTHQLRREIADYLIEHGGIFK
ncbi:MAG: acyl-CoA dehydrogenase, partial [Flammeovirgaceae bacterium]|nr:acyl-CoA dehydrogenase [Flammeovirgaceae bacterium]MDW8287035.1 acyl-CoA dehydrogenase [Flammeovirgaceae bacterium]